MCIIGTCTQNIMMPVFSNCKVGGRDAIGIILCIFLLWSATITTISIQTKEIIHSITRFLHQQLHVTQCHGKSQCVSMCSMYTIIWCYNTNTDSNIDGQEKIQSIIDRVQPYALHEGLCRRVGILKTQSTSFHESKVVCFGQSCTRNMDKVPEFLRT